MQSAFLSSIAAKVITEKLNYALEPPEILHSSYTLESYRNRKGDGSEVQRRNILSVLYNHACESNLTLFISSPADLFSPESTLRTLICSRKGKQASARSSLAPWLSGTVVEA